MLIHQPWSSPEPISSFGALIYEMRCFDYLSRSLSNIIAKCSIALGF